MSFSRKAKRYDDSVLPGDFQGFERFEEPDLRGEGVLRGAIRRSGRSIEIEHLVLETPKPKRQSFAKMRSKAEQLTRSLDYLHERLEIVDHDRRGMFIQIRSLPPYKDDNQIQFNEISIAKGRVVVKRIAFHRKEETKRQVPLFLSEEEMMRLVRDIREIL